MKHIVPNIIAKAITTAVLSSINSQFFAIPQQHSKTNAAMAGTMTYAVIRLITLKDSQTVAESLSVLHCAVKCYFVDSFFGSFAMR